MTKRVLEVGEGGSAEGADAVKGGGDADGAEVGKVGDGA